MAEDWGEEADYDQTRPSSDDDYIPKPVNSLTLCGLLVDVLVKQGWLIKQKRETQTLYFLTRKGYEKLEAMALVPDLSTPRTDDYFLFVANDNDYQSSRVKMLSSTGSVQNLGDGRVNAGNGLITNDSVFYAYRLLIDQLDHRFYRMKISGE